MPRRQWWQRCILPEVPERNRGKLPRSVGKISFYHCGQWGMGSVFSINHNVWKDEAWAVCQNHERETIILEGIISLNKITPLLIQTSTIDSGEHCNHLKLIFGRWNISPGGDTSWSTKTGWREKASHLLKAPSSLPNHWTADHQNLQAGWLLARIRPGREAQDLERSFPHFIVDRVLELHLYHCLFGQM